MSNNVIRLDVTLIRGDLGNDHCDCIVRSVSLNNDGIVRVECIKWGLGEGSLECLKCLHVVRALGNWGVFACEVNQGNDNIREPHNESVIKLQSLRTLTTLRLVGVSQTLTASVLAMSMEMPVGVTINPRIQSSGCGTGTFWVWSASCTHTDTPRHVEHDPMIFQ